MGAFGGLVHIHSHDAVVLIFNFAANLHVWRLSKFRSVAATISHHNPSFAWVEIKRTRCNIAHTHTPEKLESVRFDNATAARGRVTGYDTDLVHSFCEINGEPNRAKK